MQNWLQKRVLLSGGKTALYYQGAQYSFADLKAQADTWSEKLQGLSLPPKAPVGILGANTLATYTLILACWQLGRPIALFNFRLAPAELTTQLKDAQPAVLLVDDSLPDWPGTLAHLPGPILSYPQLAQGPRASFTPVAEFNNHQVADVMYTSGSTGTPKGVLQTFGNHFYSAIGTGLNFKLTSDDAWVCAVPLFHISGLSILLRSLIYGLGVYLEPKFDPVHINQILVDQQGTIVSVVPYMLQQLLAHLPAGAHYNPHFKCLFLGGGPIDPQTLERCVQRGIPVVQSYGMTETASNVVALSFADAPNHIGSAGKALFPVDLAIDSAHPQTPGEILLKSPTLAPGYLHQPAAYQAKFTAAGWFKTGDVGYLDEAGFLYIKGRLDTMFISGGENIFPNEITAVYSAFPGVAQVAVIGQIDAKWGAVPVALIKPEAAVQLAAAALRQFGQARLAHYKVPKRFYQVADLPKTGNGKLDLAALKRLDLASLPVIS